MSSLLLYPWGFLVHWENKGLKLHLVAQLQELVCREWNLVHKITFRVNFSALFKQKAPFLVACWPDIFGFFGNTMNEALLKLQELSPLLLDVANDNFGVCVQIQLPNGVSGWIRKNYSPNEWDAKKGYFISRFENNQSRLGSFSTLDNQSILESVKQPIMGNQWNFNSFIRPKL